AEKPATDAATPAENAAASTATNTAAATSESAAATPSTDAAAAPAAEQPKPAPKAKPKRTPPPAPVQQPSFFDDLSANPMFLPGAAVLLALLAGLGIYSSRRRKQPAKSFEDSIITDSS